MSGERGAATEPLRLRAANVPLPSPPFWGARGETRAASPLFQSAHRRLSKVENVQNLKNIHYFEPDKLTAPSSRYSGPEGSSRDSISSMRSIVSRPNSTPSNRRTSSTNSCGGFVFR